MSSSALIPQPQIEQVLQTEVGGVNINILSDSSVELRACYTWITQWPSFIIECPDSIRDTHICTVVMK